MGAVWHPGVSRAGYQGFALSSRGEGAEQKQAYHVLGQQALGAESIREGAVGSRKRSRTQGGPSAERG